MDSNHNGSDTEENWYHIKACLGNAVTEALVLEEVEIKNPWITKELLELIDERKCKIRVDANGQRKNKFLKWEII